MGRFATGIAVVVACLFASDARADERSVDRARKAIEQLDYPAAREALAEALASGASGPDALVEIYQMTGTVAASLGDTKLATDAFKKLLALRPGATLAAGTSPKIARPFAAAAEFYKKNPPLRVRTETAAQPPTVKLVIESDPLAMIAGVKVTVVVDGARERTLEGKVRAPDSAAGKARPADQVAEKGKPADQARPADKAKPTDKARPAEPAPRDPITVELPRGRRIDLRVGVVDERGNRLVELGSRDLPIVITGAELPGQAAPAPDPSGAPKVAAARPARPARPPRPLYLRWWLWTGAAAAFGGTTGYFAYRAHSEANELQGLLDASGVHRIGESTSLESRARRDVLITNLGLGLTAALAAGAAILYLTEPRRAERPGVTLAPALVEHGGAFLVRGGF